MATLLCGAPAPPGGIDGEKGGCVHVRSYRASRRRGVRLLLFIAAPVAPAHRRPTPTSSIFSLRGKPGRPRRGRGLRAPVRPVAATATAAGDAARATRAATLAAIQAAGREAAAELDAAAAKLDAHALAAPAGSDALVGASPPVGAAPPDGAAPASGPDARLLSQVPGDDPSHGEDSSGGDPCPTIADVMSTPLQDRWQVWDVNHKRSTCHLHPRECGDVSPCDVRPKIASAGGGAAVPKINEAIAAAKRPSPSGESYGSAKGARRRGGA